MLMRQGAPQKLKRDYNTEYLLWDGILETPVRVADLLTNWGIWSEKD